MDGIVITVADCSNSGQLGSGLQISRNANCKDHLKLTSIPKSKARNTR